MALNYTNIIKQAKARERKIVKLKRSGLSFQAIGDEFMISRQRAQQIYKKAVGGNAKVSGAGTASAGLPGYDADGSTKKGQK